MSEVGIRGVQTPLAMIEYAAKFCENLKPDPRFKMLVRRLPLMQKRYVLAFEEWEARKDDARMTLWDFIWWGNEPMRKLDRENVQENWKSWVESRDHDYQACWLEILLILEGASEKELSR